MSEPYIYYGMEELTVSEDEFEALVREGYAEMTGEFKGTQDMWRMVWIFKATKQTLNFLRRYPRENDSYEAKKLA
jgi:hypothetical protein